MDIALNKNGDIDFSTYDMQLDNNVMQAVAIRLKWFRNEWEYGKQYGIDYFDEIFTKGVSTKFVENVLRSEIIKVDGVVAVDDINIQIDAKTRVAKVNMRIRTSNGTEEGSVNING